MIRRRQRWALTPAALAVSLALSAATAAAQSALITGDDQRLSQWLLDNTRPGAGYPLGLLWQVPDEKPAQLALKLEVLAALAKPESMGLRPPQAQALSDLIAAMPVTGRVAVPLAQLNWLQANPSRDPLLRRGHRVELPARPSTVTVLSADGLPCRVAQVDGATARDYLDGCATAIGQEPADWAWVVQPDGRVERHGVALWNAGNQEALAPGAWIWAPPRALRIPERFSMRLAQFLATQGAAPDMPGLDTAVVRRKPASLPSAAAGLRWSEVVTEQLTPAAPAEPRGLTGKPPDSQNLYRPADPVYTANAWGGLGLLQMPSARMREEGSLAVTFSRTEPYTRYNIIAQPFSWMEAGFRYTDIANRAYGPANVTADQSYKDKGFDAKFGLWPESMWLPQVALGFIDVAGTGLFSSEYLVASKRTGSLDWTAGVAWGYLAGETRNQALVGQGGNFSFRNFFGGSPQPFGGVQWIMPWAPVVLKAEYDSNSYQNEPLGNRFDQKSHLNYGLVYRQNSWLDWTIGFERGNRVSFGIALRSDLGRLSMPKLSDPPRVPVQASRPLSTLDWSQTARDLSVQSGWQVGEIRNAGRELTVQLEDARAGYWPDRVDRAASVLHRDAPLEIDRFVLRYRSRGIDMSEHVIDRESWSAANTSPLPPSQQQASAIVRDVRPEADGEKRLFSAKGETWNTRFRIGYDQSVGGPDSFILYKFFAEQSAQLQLGRPDLWLSGGLEMRLLDNYDKFQYTAPSNLQRVRTFTREYQVTSDLTMPYLQLTHVRKLGERQYASAYAGYLEPMFAGFGGEWLYRPFASKFAFGIDANWVRQRDFDQKFSMLDPAYSVFTGHGTLYWNTGWNGVQVQASAGRYLAGDIGATLEMSRRFKNGLVLGAFATKTNISAAQFGEGSFDKGLFVSIPFDAMLTRTTSQIANFTWRPLLRDGGAKLARRETLFNLTATRDPALFEQRPAPLPNDQIKPADHTPRWTPPAERPLAVTAPAAVQNDVQWRSERSAELPLLSALERMGFRNPQVQYDGNHRLNLRVSHEQLKPLSRAAGRAATAALAHAPEGVREIRIQIAEHSDPLVEYEFFELGRLRRHLAGELPAAELKPVVAVRYVHPAAREDDPLARLADAAPLPANPALLDLVPTVITPMTVLNDVGTAAKAATRIDLVQTAGIGLAAFVGSSLLDSRGQQFAKDHANSTWLKGFNRVGGALPWIGLAGAGVMALDGSDPRRARTALSAAEAGVGAAVAATGLKYVFGRPRPNSRQSRNDFDLFGGGASSRDSMPSRQSAVAWAVATPFAEEYNMPWIYGLAAMTSLSRVGKQQHWFSDTVAGGLLGYGLGRLFWESARGNQNLPQVFVDPSGVTMNWSFR